MKKIVFLAAFALISANTMAQESEPVQEQNRNRVENRTQNQEALQAGEADGSETATQARQRLQQQENAGQAEGTQTAEQARERKMDGEAAAKARNEARRQNEGLRERQQTRPDTPAGEGQRQASPTQRRGR